MTGTFFDRLGEELDVASMRRRPSPLPKLAMAAVLVVVVGVVGVFALRPEPASADVEVEVREGLVYLRLTDAEDDPEVIEEAAAGAGLAVDVEAVPTGPSLAGRFLLFERAGALPGELRTLGTDGDTFTGFVLPAGWDGALTLRVGRPADGDEPYAAFTNAEAAGEPLACSGIGGLTAPEARDLVAETDLQVTWQAAGEVARSVPAPELDEAPWATYRVAAALSTAPRTVVVVLTPDGRPPRQQQPLTRAAEGC